MEALAKAYRFFGADGFDGDRGGEVEIHLRFGGDG